jgi:putative transposase
VASGSHRGKPRWGPVKDILIAVVDGLKGFPGAIAAARRRHWAEVIPFFAFPAEVRRIIYTTNAIEAPHAKLRHAVRTRGHFPHDDAPLRLLFLVLNRTAKE